MEPAVKEDLKLASSQGTILRIRVNRTNYGKGGFRSPGLYPIEYFTFGAIALAAACLSFCLGYKCFSWCRQCHRERSDMDCTTSCALAGVECAVSVGEQKPTENDPMGVDCCRLPRFVDRERGGDGRPDGEVNAVSKTQTRQNNRKDWNDNQTEFESSSEEEEEKEEPKRSGSFFNSLFSNDKVDEEDSIQKNTESETDNSGKLVEKFSDEEGKSKKSESPVPFFRLPKLFAKKKWKNKKVGSASSTKKKTESNGEKETEMGYVAFPPETDSSGGEEQTTRGYVPPTEDSTHLENPGGGTTTAVIPPNTNPAAGDNGELKQQLSYAEFENQIRHLRTWSGEDEAATDGSQRGEQTGESKSC